MEFAPDPSSTTPMLLDVPLVPSINSSALNYLNISANPGTLAGHDYFAPIGRKNPSLDLQDSTATHP